MHAIRELLNDYTKNNSLFLRIIHGHWARHHTKEVNAIVEQIKPGAKESLNNAQALEKIEKITKNPEGSLARRFLFLKSQVQQLKEDGDSPEKSDGLNLTSH